MKSRHTILTGVLLLSELWCANLWALTRTAYEAEMVVTGWLKANPQPLGVALGHQVVMVDTFTDEYGEPAYHIVYLYPSGFVIVSGDDLVEPIIGFADEGAYEPTPESPLGALVTNDLSRRIAAVRSRFRRLGMTLQVADTEVQKKWSYLTSLAEVSSGGFKLMGKPPSKGLSNAWVAPLVRSTWGQSCCYDSGNQPYTCYNYYTPRLVNNEVSFVENRINNYPCGCVATAMAQLMRYHRHPNEPVEPNKFTISVDGQMTDRWLLRGKGLNGAYNWNDMALCPGGNTTDEQRRAIGALCHDAGISVGTQYSAYGSGALLSDAAKALVDTFRYYNAIWGENDANGIDYQALIEMMNPNLDAKLPVILGIRDSSKPYKAHACLCDGYGYSLSTPYHHLNMGWRGQDDYWYNLPPIDCSDGSSYDIITECIYNVFTDGTGEIISGRIVNTWGSPIRDATVTGQSGTGTGPHTAITDSMGIYALKGLDPTSTYAISVNKAGYDFELLKLDTGASSYGSPTSGNKWGANFTGYPNFVTVTIGTETSEWDCPMHTGSHDSRTQVIYLADEIGRGDTITALALDVSKAPTQGMENWTIRMKHTSMSEYSTCSLDANGWTVVYQNQQQYFFTGCQKFEFQTPFEYNGTDNLLVDFSYDNSSYTENGLCRASHPGGMRSAYACSDSQDGNPLSWSGTTSPKVYGSNNIPNVELTLGRKSKMVRRDNKLIASDGEAEDHFGCSVSIDGDYAIAGAYGDDNNRGSAYIFKHEDTSWTQQAKLTGSDREAKDYFGCSVSISGDYAIVGSYGDNDWGGDSGTAYIFKREGTGWMQQAKLTASDRHAYAKFGGSVSISGDYAIMGAASDDEGGIGSGAAYIFKREGTTWVQQAKLTASDGAPYKRFGSSVSISGDYAIVGSYGDDDNRASAYIFKHEDTSWTEQTKLTALDGSGRDLFAHSVSISGNYAIVGTPGDDDKGTDSGSAYIFKRDGTSWTQQVKLTAPDGKSLDLFGNSVSISGDYAIVGVPCSDDYYKGNDCGFAYVFKRQGTNWAQQAKLTALDGTEADLFGSSVSISGDYTIIGAQGDGEKGSNSGSAYIYVLAQRTVTMSSTAGGSVSTPGEGPFQYDQGAIVPIEATADPNYRFVNWTGSAVDAGKVADPNAASTTITIDADYSLQANFTVVTIAQHTLTISSRGGGSVSKPGEGLYQYYHGSSVPIQAAALPNYHFVNWTGTAVDASRVADPNAASTSLIIDADYTLVANFSWVAVKLVTRPEASDCSVTMAPEHWPTYHKREAFQLELWAQIASGGPDSNGLSCVFGDVTFDSDVLSAESIEYCTNFSAFSSGTVKNGLIGELGGCTLTAGLGIAPEWALVARIQMTALAEGQTDMSLSFAETGVSVIGHGLVPSNQISLGSCQVTVGDIPETCFYDLDGDNSIGPGDLALFACCWLHPAADSGCSGRIPCLQCNFDCDGAVGPGDLAWFATGWLKQCGHASIQVPPCSDEQTAASNLSASSLQSSASDVEVHPIILASPSLLDTTGTLPTSVSSVSEGQDYYVEVWASDVGGTNTGLTSVYVDMCFIPSDVVSVLAIDHGGTFTMFPSGIIEPWGIDELGGSSLAGVGVEPAWTRVAVVKFQARVSVTISCTLSYSSRGVAALARGLISEANTRFPCNVSCFPSTYSAYSDWLALGKPSCWCQPYQCDGDADGKDSDGPAKYRVYTGDLGVIVANWKKKAGDPTLDPCADIDHKDSGGLTKYRVFTGDLSVLVANWKKKDADLTGDCPRAE